MPRRQAITALGAATLGAAMLTACGATVSATFEQVGESLDSPPAATSTAPAEESGTLTIEAGAIADGPGESVTEALAAARDEPTLVNGIVLKDLDGVIWLCEELADTSPPSCGEPRLRLLDYPEGTADWDMATGELIGLQEEAGVLWREGAQFFGVVEP